MIAQVHSPAVQVFASSIRRWFSNDQPAQFVQFRFGPAGQIWSGPARLTEFCDDALEEFLGLSGCLLVLAILGLVLEQRRQCETRNAPNLRTRVILQNRFEQFLGTAMAHSLQPIAEMDQIRVGGVFSQYDLGGFFNLRSVGCVEENPCAGFQSVW